MTGELVYSVQGTSAQPMRVSTLAAAGLRERDHLQEWVLANPEILGDDVLVVTSEFDQWFSKDGRDPALIGEQIDRLLLDRGWNVDVSAGAVMGRWPVIVGPDVAAHSTPVTFTDGELLVRADSTAWATQLRYMTSTLLGRLEAEAGPGVVTSLQIVGPSAPSWRKGPRRAAGPGPRDTYG